MIKMIIATDVRGGIGFQNKLPWCCPEDLQYFKEQTEGSTVVMGRNTWVSLQRLGMKNGLPERINKVITSQSKFLTGNMRKEHYISMGVVKNKLLRQAKFYGDEVFIMGGKSLYEQLFHLVDEVHHTTIKGDYECDTFVDTCMWEDNTNWFLDEVKTLSEVAEVKIWRKA
ncbi:putative dihydrofolate reductase [Vibrio phage VPMCC14]|nr:putative dihydrofolate reductase [Vibrio phage VPMCC14]